MLDLIVFGEILWDMIDGQAHIGGAPFNFAAHAVQCGLRTAIVKVNEDEAALLGERLFGGALLSRHADTQIVVVTLGAEGCIVCTRDAQARHVPAKAVQVVDTIGAGDAFSAAFLSAWLDGASAVTAAEAGNARGALVAGIRGAIPA